MVVPLIHVTEINIYHNVYWKVINFVSSFADILFKNIKQISCKFIYFGYLTIKHMEWIIRINFWTTSSWKTGLCVICSLNKSAWLATRFHIINLALFDSVLQRFELPGLLFRCLFAQKFWTPELVPCERNAITTGMNLATAVLYGGFIVQSISRDSSIVRLYLLRICTETCTGAADRWISILKMLWCSNHLKTLVKSKEIIF